MPEDKKAAVPGEAESFIGSNPTRREFIGTALTVGAGMAIASVLPFAGETVEAQTACNVPTGETLVKIGQIDKPQGSTGPVQGVIKILNEKKSYLVGSKAQSGTNVCETGQMRYLTGSRPGGPQVWPLAPQKGLPAPGPTIRARVGDTVEITLMNQVDVNAFATSTDAGKALPLDKGNGCDSVTSTGPGGSVNTYPGSPAFDQMPNSFHGSSTANLH